MKKIKSIVASATLAAIVTTTSIVSVSAKVNNRLGGHTRYGTAVAIANELYSGTVDNIVLASGKAPYDALAASLFAKNMNAPILLADSNKEACKETFEYIQKHLSKSGTIYILGGEASVNKDMESELKKLGYKTERVAGKDRFETNSKIIDKLTIPKGTPVFIVSDTGFADALSVSNISAIKGYPLIMTSKDKLSADLKAQLNKIQPSKVYVISSENLISNNIINEIKAINANLKDTDILRIAGKNRYDTNLLIDKAFNLQSKDAVIASGKGSGDALTGSVLATKLNAPIVLTDGKDFAKQRAYLNSTGYINQYILGLEGSVSKSIEDSLNAPVADQKDGQEFLGKLMNAEQIKSLETKSNSTITLTSNGLPAEMQNGFNQLTSTIGNTITLDVSGKVQSISDTNIKEELNTSVKLGGIMGKKPISFPMYLDVDMSDTVNPSYKVIYGLPKEYTDMASSMDPSLSMLKGKEYMVLDMASMNNLDSSEDMPKVDYTKMTDFVEKNKARIDKLELKYALQYNPNVNIVTKLGNKKTVDGRDATCYQVTLNNETLSSLISYTGNNALNFIEQKEIIDFVKDYMEVCINAMESPTKDKAEYQKEFAELLANMPSNTLGFNKFMDAFSSMEFLGKDGIKINYYLDDKGRTIYEDGVMDINLDLSKMQKLFTVDNPNLPEETKKQMNKDMASLKGSVGMNVKFSTSLTKLNDSSINVTLPSLTESNSIDYVKFLNSLVQSETEAENKAK